MTGPLDWWLWGGAVAVADRQTLLLGRVEHGFELNPTHFAERHGLMILIALGESLVSVGQAVTASDANVSPALLLGALAGLAASAAMWWAYFVGEDERVARAHEHAGQRQRADQGIRPPLRSRAPDYGFRHHRRCGGDQVFVARTAGADADVWSRPDFRRGVRFTCSAAPCFDGRWGMRALPLDLQARSPASVYRRPGSVNGPTAASLGAVAVVISVTIAIERYTDSRFAPSGSRRR